MPIYSFVRCSICKVYSLLPNFNCLGLSGLIIYFCGVKFICLLLSVYVIVLSTKPCCADFDCRSKEATSKQLNHNSPVKEKECPGCSPFFTCGTCVGFIVSQQLTLQLPVSATAKMPFTIFYKQPAIEKVFLSIWLPPKIS